jgi:hypothetical protein
VDTALDAIAAETEVVIGGERITVSSPDRVLLSTIQVFMSIYTIPTSSSFGIHHAGNSWCCQISRNVPICLFDALFRELADDVWSAEEFFKSCFWFTNTDQDQAKEDSARLYDDWQSLVIQRNIFTSPIHNPRWDRMTCRQLKTWPCKISTDEQREIPTTQDTRFQPHPIYITHSTAG